MPKKPGTLSKGKGAARKPLPKNAQPKQILVAAPTISIITLRKVVISHGYAKICGAGENGARRALNVLSDGEMDTSFIEDYKEEVVRFFR